MLWVIHGDGQPQNPQGYDGSVRQWQLLADDDPDRQHQVLVRITGTAMAMGEDALSIRAATARETQGRSEVEQVLEWPQPPDEIEIGSTGVRRFGGDPGPEQREINEIVEWFDERGAIVMFTARRGGVGSVENALWVKHSAHVLARDVDQHLYHAEGSSRLEAARHAKERWDAEGHGVLLGKLEAHGSSTTTLELDTAKAAHKVKADEAARTQQRQVFQVTWEEVTDPRSPNPLHKVEVSTEDGEVTEIALGDDVEDGVLEIALSLLPKQGKSPEQS
jgi:hypothetical protein